MLTTNEIGNITEQEPKMAHALLRIKSDYGHKATITGKAKSLIKYGRNDNLSTTEQTICSQGGKEVYATANTIDSVVSSNVGDTQEVVIEGHTLSGSDFTFVTQAVTLNGTTPVTLSTPMARANRLYNNDSTDFTGDVYVYESGGTVTDGVPQVSDDIHLKALAGDNNQSLKAATTISSQDYWIITAVSCGVNRQNTRSVDNRIKVREFGKVFRTKLPPIASTSGNGTTFIPLDPYLIIRPNSDIRVDATSSGSATGASAALYGYLAKIVD